ncbi:MAG: hypothetical protein IPM57_08820 [Oligoflexia bacterium]|nr:hypothetical protein [Oligoflexia bacterium]
MIKFLWLAATLHAQILGYNFFSPHDASLNWKVKETENFEIVYTASVENLAQKVADEAERSHKILNPLLKVKPSTKTVIIISDNTDSSNGSAIGWPRPTIEIYPILPHYTDTIGEYHDWIQELILHEYAHILNFEPYSGVVGVGRTLLGSIWKPPTFLPRWYTEGFAVEMETRFTKGGRGRSILYEAQARAFFEESKWGLEGIDRINSTSIPTWPRGQRPYYFGWLLHYEMGKQKGLSIFEELNTRYGGHFPWFINGPMEDNFGLDYEDFLNKTYETYGLKIKAQLEHLKNSGIVNGVKLNQKGYFNFSPQISPDGLKLAAVTSDYNQDQSIMVWQRSSLNDSFSKSTEPTTVTTGKNIHQVDWIDNSTLVFDQQAQWKHYNNYNDIYVVDINTKNPEQITFGKRAREALSVSKNKFVFVEHEGASAKLVLFDKEKDLTQVIASPPMGYNISKLKKVKNGFVYFIKDALGNETQKSYSFLTNEKTSEEFSFIKNGQIYSQSRNSEKLIATNTTQAVDPVIDANTKEVIYSRLTSDGYLLEAKKIKDSHSYPKLDPLFKFNEDNTPTLKVKSNDSNYSGLSYLFPQYWMPFVYFVPGGSLITASTSANDPLYLHQYTLDIGYDTRAQKLKQAASYTNNTLPFAINMYFSNNFEYLVGLNAVERIVYGSLSTSHFLQEHLNEWSIQPQISYKMTDYPGYLFTEAGPGIYLNFSNIGSKKDYQISPESGLSFSIGYNYFLPSWGNVSYQGVSITSSYYLSGWFLPKRNVVKLRGAGWISPPQSTILTGYQQAGGEYGSPFWMQSLLVRGYPYGEFIGNNIANFGIEYRLPLAYPFGGPGTIPLFTNAWHLALVADTITLDGGYYDTYSLGLRATSFGKFYSSAGVEFKGDFTLFYFAPVTLKAAYYYAFSQEALGGSLIFIGFGSSL